MRLKDYCDSITFRCPISILEKLDSTVGKGKKYKNRSEAILAKLQLSSKIESMMDLFQDPKKKKEFQSKFQELLSKKDVEQTLEKMDEKELKAIIFFAENQLDKRFKQLLLDIQRQK